jgi:hypothetical protein
LLPRSLKKFGNKTKYESKNFWRKKFGSKPEAQTKAAILGNLEHNTSVAPHPPSTSHG